jgi:flagellar assembly protein FliH
MRKAISGLVDGANASESAAEEGLLELRRLIDLFKTEQRAALARDEKDLIEIAFEVAKKIMKQHVHADENAVQKMLEEIVPKMREALRSIFRSIRRLWICILIKRQRRRCAA